MPARWTLEDDCLAPERVIRVDFKGVNPFKVYQAMPQALRVIYDVRGKDIFEKEFRWDYSEDPRSFFFRFIVRKKYDMWSNVWTEVAAQGKQPSDMNKEGEVYVLVTSKLLTKSPEDNPWTKSALYKSLRWVYYRTLYNDVRRNLLEECRIKANDLKRTVERTLGISASAMMS